MKRFFTLTATLIALSPALAAATDFSVGVNGSTGSVFSGSETGSHSRTETWGNGDASHTAFTGATNSSRVTVGGHLGGGDVTSRVSTFTEGETFSKSVGEQNGSAISNGKGTADQRGSAFGEGRAFTGQGGFSVGGKFGFGRF